MTTSLRTRVRWTASILSGRSELALPAPWQYVQEVVEARLHEYLGCAAADVGRIVVVGAHRGREVRRLLARYPASDVVCLEPQQDEFELLVRSYGGDPRVRCICAAAAADAGTAALRVMDRNDSSSLLVPTAGETRFSIADTIEVETVALDALGLGRVDLLWIDVQGFEADVLRGAQALLGETRAIFCEVAVAASPYVGGTLMPEIEQLLAPHGFRLWLLGTGAGNGEGNALFLRRPGADRA